MYQSEVKRVLQLIDQWGNETTIEKGGQMSIIKHQKVLAVFEKWALRYKHGQGYKEIIDKTGTVSTAGLTYEESEEDEVACMSMHEVRQEEIFSTLGVQGEVLKVHGVAPERKAEGMVRLIYENLDGLANTISGNAKLEKERGIIDDLEADLACFNEHNKI
jgi:hypothetical protein